MFELKKYQKQALEVLEKFLVATRSQPVESAFEQALIRQKQNPVFYRHYAFEQMPYVCLRLPTGGGKTVLASYTVKVVKQAYLEEDYRVLLWLVRTNTIREQTLKAIIVVGTLWQP